MAFRGLKHYKDILKGTPKQHKEWLSDYVRYRQKTVRGQSAGAELSGLKHFFWINEVDGIDWERIRANLKESIKSVEDKPYTHEQIAKLISKCPPKGRIVVYSEASGGPRIGAFPSMKVGDLQKIDNIGIYRVVVYPRTKAKYVTFFGLEATKEIDDYLAYREKLGEKITVDSPLIRNDFNAKSVNPVKPITKATIESVISLAAEKAGLRVRQTGGRPYQRKEIMLTHGLRKFFKQWCRRAGVDPLVLERMMGHRSGDRSMGVDKLMLVYDPVDADELLQNYLKAINNLTINEETRLKVKTEELQNTVRVQDEALQRAMDALTYLQSRANEIG